MRRGSEFIRLILSLLLVFKENVFDIFTEIVPFMPWINRTIMSMGGMQACGFTLEETQPEGSLALQSFLCTLRKKGTSCPFLCLTDIF